MNMFDFKPITQITDLYNLHTHTQFCDGHAAMEEFVVEAIEQGIRHLGFTPHSPISVESPCNMTREDVPVYLSEVERLRKAYGDRIKIYAAMEIDYVSVGDGPAADYFRQLPLKFLLMRALKPGYLPSISTISLGLSMAGMKCTDPIL